MFMLTFARLKDLVKDDEPLFLFGDFNFRLDLQAVIKVCGSVCMCVIWYFVHECRVCVGM